MLRQGNGPGFTFPVLVPDTPYPSPSPPPSLPANARFLALPSKLSTPSIARCPSNGNAEAISQVPGRALSYGNRLATEFTFSKMVNMGPNLPPVMTLTVFVNSDPHMHGQKLEALVLANNGAYCIDEFDKVPSRKWEYMASSIIVNGTTTSTESREGNVEGMDLIDFHAYIKLENAIDINIIFPSKSQTYSINGVQTTDHFAMDYTLKELLSNVLLTQGVFSRSDRFDGSLFSILTVKVSKTWLKQQTFHDDWSVIEQPVARNSQELNIFASSNPSFHDTIVCLCRNCELDSTQVSWGDQEKKALSELLSKISNCIWFERLLPFLGDFGEQGLIPPSTTHSLRIDTQKKENLSSYHCIQAHILWFSSSFVQVRHF
ncbi:hypothetical protein VNO77_31600 [Canavalia gladiata]|uniref:glycerophosphodiester phosphodiesterase n=1 Tax=Canavalia gladiata TaxID=3824 RepID=A0AAN9KS03_CANGL